MLEQFQTRSSCSSYQGKSVKRRNMFLVAVLGEQINSVGIEVWLSHRYQFPHEAFRAFHSWGPIRLPQSIIEPRADHRDINIRFLIFDVKLLYGLNNFNDNLVLWYSIVRLFKSNFSMFIRKRDISCGISSLCGNGVHMNRLYWTESGCVEIA